MASGLAFGPNAAALTERALRCVRESGIVSRARDQIAVSRRRIFRRRAICGAAPLPGDLRERIRAGLAAGTLPRISGRALAVTVQGNHQCACGQRIIGASSPEYEVADLPGIHAHPECFGIWVAESTDATGAGSPGPLAVHGRPARGGGVSSLVRARNQGASSEASRAATTSIDSAKSQPTSRPQRASGRGVPRRRRRRMRTPRWRTDRRCERESMRSGGAAATVRLSR